MNINYTFDRSYIAKLTLLMIDTVPTSHFPGSSFLNFILYGTGDKLYDFPDFLNSYGYA